MSLVDEAAAPRAGEALDAAVLGEYLARQLPGLVLPLAVRQFPAGFSNLSYLLRAGGREMVLRRPPFGTRPKSGHDMGREFRVLSALAGHFAESPRPLPCPYCNSSHTRFDKKVGVRAVWRCFGCCRTFWPSHSASARHTSSWGDTDAPG